MTDPQREAPPYRVVDRDQYGWHTVGSAAGALRYETYPWPPDVAPGTEIDYPRLRALRSPLRPVVAAPEPALTALRQVLIAAGTKAVATVCVALYSVDRQLRQLDGHGRRLIAGRPGSWESALLPSLAWEVGSDIGTGRVDDLACGSIVSTVRDWVTNPDRYVEVAENLAAVLGGVVDTCGGWDAVADRWIRAHPGAERIRGYVVSQSSHPV